MSLNPTPPDTAGEGRLLPCPFCGGDDIKLYRLMDELDSWAAHCRNCLAEALRDDKEGATAAWNRRDLPPMGNVAWKAEQFHVCSGEEVIGDAHEMADAESIADRHNSEVATLTQALTDLRREGDEAKAKFARLNADATALAQLSKENRELRDGQEAQLRADAAQMAGTLLQFAEDEYIVLGDDYAALCRKYTPAPLPAPQQAE